VPGRGTLRIMLVDSLFALTIHGDLAGTCVGTEKGAPDLGE
jgi:hypothetical protein